MHFRTSCIVDQKSPNVSLIKPRQNLLGEHIPRSQTPYICAHTYSQMDALPKILYQKQFPLLANKISRKKQIGETSWERLHTCYAP